MYTYLACPYSDPDELTRLRRFRHSRQIAAYFALADIPVFSPVLHGHSMLYEFVNYEDKLTHDFWMTQCLPLVRYAQQLVILTLPGWTDSLGVSEERRLAHTCGIQVYFINPLNIPTRSREAITYIRDNYSHKPAAPGVQPRKAPGPDGVHPDPRADAPTGSP